MKPIIYVRDTTNWKKQKLTRSVQGVSVEKLVYKWNYFFSMSFWDYRDAIKKIAMSSWKKAGCRTHIMNFDKLDFNDDDYILPTDDDDWISPDIEIDSDEDVVVWESVVHGSIENHRFSLWWDKQRGCPCSNNYAVRGSYLRKLPLHQKRIILSQHGELFNIAKDVHKIPNVYSCYNWHPGSVSTEGKYPDIIKKIPREFDMDAKVLAQNAWCIPYATDFVEILKNIRFNKVLA